MVSPLPKPWDTLSSDRVGDFRIFQLRKDRCVSPRTGEAFDFFVLEMPDWCNVVALTRHDEMILVKQYRFGIRESSLEIPGGMIEDGEDPLAAARRELLEETGFACDRIELIGRTLPNPAIQDNVCHTALATGCHRLGDPHLDEREDIEILLRPAADIQDLVAKGEINHALVLVALEQWKKRSR